MQRKQVKYCPKKKKNIEILILEPGCAARAFFSAAQTPDLEIRSFGNTFSASA